jgi:tetratricopeptide (TPR) repeat protein
MIMTARGREEGLAIWLLGGLLLLSCSSGEVVEPTGEAAALATVPHPNLAAAEAGVQDHVGRQRRRLEDLLARDSPAPAALAEAFADLGLVYVLYDFPEAAQVCFENARTLGPDDYRWHYLLGYAWLLQGEPAVASSHLEAALVLRSDFVPAMLRLGRARLELGDRQAARHRFEAALATDPTSAAALEGLGKLAAAQGEPAVAAEYFRQALAEAPAASSLHYGLGQAYRDLGRLDEARRELERSGDAAVPIDDPLIGPLAGLAESTQLYLMQGAEALGDENFEVAAVAYGRVLERDPESFAAYRGLAYSLEKLGDLEGAIRRLEAGLERGTTADPRQDRRERADLHRILGGLEALRERDEAAIGHFAAALRLEPDQADVQMKLANALAREGRLEEALGHYARLLQSNPADAADILVKRATVRINLGQTNEALEDFRQATELRPGDGGLRLRYAEALEHLGRQRQAAEQRRLAEGSRDGTSPAVATLLATADDLIRRGQYEAAVERLSEILQNEPDHLDARQQLASVLGHLRRYGDAASEFRQVVEGEPRHQGARHGEIISLTLLGRYGEARVRLNEALRIFSHDARLAHLQARLLATAPDPRVRDGRLALEVASRLDQAVGDLRIRETLAMAHAEMGQLDRARELQRVLVAEALQNGDDLLAQDLRAKLRAFESGRAWSAAGPEEILDATVGRRH